MVKQRRIDVRPEALGSTERECGTKDNRKDKSFHWWFMPVAA
jgi:hypothetical protein